MTMSPTSAREKFLLRRKKYLNNIEIIFIYHIINYIIRRDFRSDRERQLFMNPNVAQSETTSVNGLNKKKLETLEKLLLNIN